MHTKLQYQSLSFSLFPFHQFLAKALTALITAPPKAHPSPYLKPRAMQQNAELSQVLLNSWSDLVYHAAELMVPLVADETKVTHVCLLYAAGLDQTAEEVYYSYTLMLW